MTSGERRKRLLKRFLRGHMALLFGVVLQGMKSGELDTSINPVVAMACAIGLGGAASGIVRFVKGQVARVTDDDEVPSAMRVAAAALQQQFPNSDALAETLTRLVLRALGNRPSGLA
jgi:hypothetical protein